MMSRLASLAMSACVLLAGVACADEASLRGAIEAKFPRANVQSITEVPGLGLFELVIDGEIYYADGKFDFLIDGNVIDTKSMTNLTAARKQEVQAQELEQLAFPFEELPLDMAFRKVIGDGSRKVAYFADPNCGACRKFENETLPKLKNVTIYTFLYPIISADSVPLTKAIWCSPNRARAWDDYVLRGVRPKSPGNCENPVDQLLAFGRDKRIRGTPTLIFADGTRIPGALKVEHMEDMLSKSMSN
ncbi:MAG: DsbC family protein [Burkholderiales bacterium]